MTIDVWQALLLVAVGAIVGVVNVLAGGGSALTLPVLILLGFPPATANGTNRVALLVQNVSAVTSFRRRGFADVRRSLRLAALTLPGAILGAVAAVRIDPVWFKRVLAVVMVGVLVLVLRGSRRTADRRATAAHPVAAGVAMVGVGFYGGFVQVGVGFLIIAALQGLLRLDLVRVNMHKVFVVGVYMVPSLLVFALAGHVDWWAGAALAVGTASGAWIGAHVAVRGGERVIRWIVAAAILALAIRLVL